MAVKPRAFSLDRKFNHDIVKALDNLAILETHTSLQENLSMAHRVHQRAAFRGHLIESLEEHLQVIDRVERQDIYGAWNRYR